MSLIKWVKKYYGLVSLILSIIPPILYLFMIRLTEFIGLNNTLMILYSFVIFSTPIFLITSIILGRFSLKQQGHNWKAQIALIISLIGLVFWIFVLIFSLTFNGF